MFALNEALARWRRGFQECGLRRRVDLDELESHLREEMDRLVASGLSQEAAFHEAASRLGEPAPLREEFAKNRGFGRQIVESVGEGVLGMKNSGLKERSNKFTLLMLFIGFSGLAGWIGTTGFLATHTGGFRSGGFGAKLLMISVWGLFDSFFLIFAAVGLVWGLRLLRRRERKLKFLLGSLLPALALSPAYAIAGTLLILFTPVLFATIFQPNKIVQSVASPDGRYTAYCVDKPSIDGPNHHFYARMAGQKKAREVGRLMEDVDCLKKIIMSPRGDMVVFSNNYTLFAVSLPDFKSAVVPLGGKMVWHGGTFRINGRPSVVSAVEFPTPGVFRYRLESGGEFISVSSEAFKQRSDDFLVDRFEEIHH